MLLGGLIWGAYRLAHVEEQGPQCPYATCPLELHESDSGNTFTYGKSTTITVVLNGNTNPPQDLICTPDGVISAITGEYLQEPLYAAHFSTVATGRCTLKDDRFSATIVVR